MSDRDPFTQRYSPNLFADWAPEVLRAALSEETEQLCPPSRFSSDKLMPVDLDLALRPLDLEFPPASRVDPLRGAIPLPPPRGWIVMHPQDFMDLRRWGRDIIDQETCAPRPSTGAEIWGYGVMTTRDLPRRTAWVVGRRPNTGTLGRARIEWGTQE